MAQNLRKDIWKLMQLVEGLEAVIIADRDGVPIIKVSTELVPDASTRPAFLATFATAADQASKLGLSQNKSIICSFHSYQVVHFNKSPVYISLIATTDTNTGNSAEKFEWHTISWQTLLGATLQELHNPQYVRSGPATVAAVVLRGALSEGLLLGLEPELDNIVSLVGRTIQAE